jgi:hypothetical protein
MNRVVILAGHYGSGKTTVAVNLACRSAQSGKPTVLVDLDVVNPYFRSADSRKALEAAGAELVSSNFVNSNVESVWLPAGFVEHLEDDNEQVFVDVGGDDGATVLGRYGIKDCDFWMVVNPYRPLSAEIRMILELRKEMEAAAGLRFTGIVSNPNLGRETMPATIAAKLPMMKALAHAAGLPIVLSCVPEAVPFQAPLPGEKLPLTLYTKEAWSIYG